MAETREVATRMRAAVRREYGTADVVRIEEVATPTPGEGDVLIEVRAAATNPLDWHMLTGTPYLVRPSAGWRTPKVPILGADVAGVVVAKGAGVDEFEIGDAVFGEIGGGTYAEYAKGPARLLAAKPESMSFEQAAAIGVAGLTALQGLRDKAQLTAGERVLVIGASGGVGSFAVQIAKAMGAEVAGVASTANLDLVRSLGADEVYDYTAQPFAAVGGGYDVIFDMVGNQPLRVVGGALADGGRYISVGGPKRKFFGPMIRVLRGMVLSWFTKGTLTMMLAKADGDDLAELAGMFESGELTPVIQRVVRLEDLAGALSDLPKGRAAGKTVISLEV